MNILSIFYNLLPIKKDKIVFYTMNGTYGCNPKHICNEIIRRKLPCELVWITDRTREAGNFPPEVRLVPTGLKAAWERSTCRVMIHNTRKSYFSEGFRKKKGQTYIQTWHGSYGIKKIEGDCPGTLSAKYLKRAKIDSANIDCLLSCGTWSTETFERSFFCKRNVILETGMPRNDIFFTSTDKYAAQVREHYKLPPDTKLALYAPTFRDDHHLECYQLDYQRLKQELTAKFGGNWVVIARLHPNIAHLFEQLPPNNRDVINGCDYPDMQELMCGCDFMISDYSSCIFDFMLSRKPGFIFATDIELYNTDRGFCYPLEETPFPIATSNDQLVENIRKFDKESYEAAVEAFLSGKGACDDGHASERCVDYIESRLNDPI